MRKSTLIFLFISVALLVVVPARAQTIDTTTSTPQITATSTPQSAPAPIATTTIPLLIQKIHDAKTMLDDVKLEYAITPVYKTKKISKTKSKRTITGYSVYNQQIMLAVYDPVSGQITIVKGTQNGKKFSFPDTTVTVAALGFNGVNTRFAVYKPANGIVVALKYLITPKSAGSKKSLEAQLRHVVYAPYSEALNQPDIYRYGNEYIDGAIQKAIDQLHDIRSAVSSGLSVAAAVEPALIKALIYSEHMDDGQLLNNPDTQGLVNKVNVLFAINEGDTFRYSASTASARGISQFIPSTYKSLVKRHANAQLIPDFVAGMEDHVNAIKASFLLIDDYTAAVKQGLGGAFQDFDAWYYGAAAYNGGVTRVVRAVKQYGEDWHLDRSTRIASLNRSIAGQKSVVASLKSKYKKAKKTADRKSLKDQLYTAEVILNHLRNDLAAAQRATLKAETVGYIGKMEKLITLFTGHSA